MPEELYKKIFSKNLNHYMEINGKNQSDIVNDLGFNKSAVSTWCNGTRLPRMDKVEALARYFGINRSDLIEEKTTDALLTKKDERDIAKTLEETLSQLESDQEGLLFSGEALDDETRELLKISLENSIRMAKITAKKKFTPKKYRKESE